MKEVKMPKQTSINWLIEQLQKIGFEDIIEKLPDTIGYARMLHKDELENAYDEGNSDGYNMAKNLDEYVQYLTPEDFYLKTYDYYN